MKVILKESYMTLGEAGEVVNVKPGYARNFLIPQKIAISATPGNIRLFLDKKKEIETKKEVQRDSSRKLLDSLKEVSLTMKKRVADDGKLFGSVTTKELEEEFNKLGLKVDRRQIVLGTPIKMAGEYSILVKLVGGLKAQVPLHVVSDAPPKTEN
jgi:large subunit ribosomal protein L9